MEENLTGYHCLAIPGPTNMPFEIRQAMELPLEDHRAPDFGEFTLPLLHDLKKIFRTQTGRVFVFPGSGTGGWESAIANTLSEGDKILTSVFGHFSHLWADMCRRYKLNVDVINENWGRGVPLDKYREALENDKDHSIRAVLVCHNETATGVTSDIMAVRQILDDLSHPALLFVDGVSSIGSLEFHMDYWGVDVAVCASQKGFMMPTGLAIVGVSKRALSLCEKANLPRYFFDFSEMARMNDDGYFPYTPSTNLLRGLRASVDMLLSEGLDNVYRRHFRLAEGVRRAVSAWGLSLCAEGSELSSDTVTAVKVRPGTDANEIIKCAYYDFKVSLGGGLSQLNGSVFRIGHLGWTNETMILQALGGVELAMLKSGVLFEPGAGVAAAIQHYSGTKRLVLQAA